MGAGGAYSSGWWTLVGPRGGPSFRVGFSLHRTLFYQLKSEVLNYSESTINETHGYNHDFTGCPKSSFLYFFKSVFQYDWAW